MNDTNSLCSTSITIDFRIFLFFPLIVLIVPLKHLLAIVAAATVHEAGHILATAVLGGQLNCIRLTVLGARIDVVNTTKFNTIISTLAGPLSGFLLLFFIHSLPLLSIFGCVQGFFNLLPIYPLDGGRIARILRN